MKMGLEQGLNLVATTMNNSVDSPKTNTEIMVISSNEIRNLTSDELENLYNSVQKVNPELKKRKIIYVHQLTPRPLT